jgi:hypothetical protein
VRLERVHAFAERQEHVEQGRGKGIGVFWVPFGPPALDDLHLREPSRDFLAQLSDESKRFVQIAEFVHQVDFCQKQNALVAQLRRFLEPFTQNAMPGRGGLVDAPARPTLCGRFVAAQ